MKNIKQLKKLLIIICFITCVFVSSAAQVQETDRPLIFDITGKIDRISNNRLVIDDVLFKLSLSTTYHAPDLIFTQSSDFKKGYFVGLMLKDKSTREVLCVWLLEKPD